MLCPRPNLKLSMRLVPRLALNFIRRLSMRLCPRLFRRLYPRLILRLVPKVIPRLSQRPSQRLLLRLPQMVRWYTASVIHSGLGKGLDIETGMIRFTVCPVASEMTRFASSGLRFRTRPSEYWSDSMRSVSGRMSFSAG